MKKFSVYGSEKNIEDGTKNNPCLCPIALAISDKYKIFPKRIYVSPETMLIRNGHHYYFKLSKEGVNFIKRYDAGLYVDPITIEGKLVREYELQ